MYTVWEKREKTKPSIDLEKLSQELKISPMVTELLTSRDITSPEEAKRFLWPKLSDLYDTSSIPDIEKALERIIAAVENQEIITIYGDYDADGTVATAILMRYLRSVEANVNYYIPNRLTEGYGLNKEAIDKIAARGTDLVITVDNGISALEEADYLNELGIDLVVTDHHETKETLPKALAVLDLKRSDSQYPFNELCGAGLAFKLVLALNEILQADINIEEYLQMATISTIADLVPLVDENRTIAKLGINSINKNGFYNKGLNRLLEKSELDEVGSYAIGFRIGPMINAPGRLGQVEEVMALLLSDNDEVLEEKAELLFESNQNRTLIEKRIITEALKKVEEEKLYEQDVIIVDGSNWHSGVIGIVASKIQDKWNKPVVIISFDEQGMGKGSCRSIPGFDINKALTYASEFLISYGGHEQAAGLSINRSDLNQFKSKIFEYAKSQPMKSLFKKKLYYDKEITPEEANEQIIKELQLFEPTGIGNPAPVFKVKSQKITGQRQIGNQKNHLSFNADNIRSIAFGLGEKYQAPITTPVTFLAKPEINCYNNCKNVQFKVKDIKENPFISFNEAESILQNTDSKEELIKSLDNYGKPVTIDRKLLIYLYNLIKSRGKFPINHFLTNTGESVFSLVASLMILKEASLIDYSYDNNIIQATIIPSNEKKDLTSTKIYQLLN